MSLEPSKSHTHTHTHAHTHAHTLHSHACAVFRYSRWHPDSAAGSRRTRSRPSAKTTPPGPPRAPRRRLLPRRPPSARRSRRPWTPPPPSLTAPAPSLIGSGPELWSEGFDSHYKTIQFQSSLRTCSQTTVSSLCSSVVEPRPLHYTQHPSHRNSGNSGHRTPRRSPASLNPPEVNHRK